ncbi:MAG: hypothetical protein DRG59_04515 [Deltaproteobacteria bacterium]|nr:MAG: hypothetical protein DRG59_04515 [Deltaproteobacteria bacterium]
MNRKSNLRLGLLVCILIISFVLAGCSRKPSHEFIRIGEIDPLTGKLARHGLEIHEGILLAIEETNLKGGIKGKNVELVTRDDQSLPEVAYGLVQELVQKEKVVAITGGYVDTLVAVISEAARKSEVPYVAAASLQEELTKTKNPYFFRISKLSGFLKPVERFLVEVIKPRKVGILYASTPGSTEFATKLVEFLKIKNIQVPFQEKFRTGISDFTPLIIKMTRYDLDFIISGGFLPDHLLLIRQLKQNNYPLKGYLGPWGIAYPSFVSQMKKDAELLCSTCAWNPGITLPGTEQVSREFVENFEKRFNKTPSTTNMHGYTAAMVIIDALKRTNLDNNNLKNDLRNAISATDLILPMEHVAFDQNGDPLNYEHVIIQIQNGRFVCVYPPERATGKLVYPITD